VAAPVGTAREWDLCEWGSEKDETAPIESRHL